MPRGVAPPLLLRCAGTLIVMTRHMLIRAETEPARVVEEAALPTEAELHGALTNHPQLIPAADIGLGETVVVGRESGLASGYADLVLLDDRGRLCLVEVKNEGNPDTRRVVAQLLDYAASLWGLSIQEFEQKILHPFLVATGRGAPLPTVAEYVAEATQRGGGGAEDLVDQLAQTLAAGDFALVVAAPQIPIGVQRVLEYLNARGQRMFGLEVSYFRGPVECFVPRLVVKPLISDPAGESTSGATLDEETFLDQIPARCREAIAGFLSAVTDAGADVLWRKYGPSITVTRGNQRQVAYIEAKRLGVTLKASADFPQEAFDQARTQLTTVGAGGETKDGWYYNIPFTDASDEQLSTALGVAQALVDAVVPPVAFVTLAPETDATFSRNDHNVWARHVPVLAALQGVHLRGRLMHVPSGREADVHLVPLANGQPGWRPRFNPSSTRDEVWSAAFNGDRFRLLVNATSPGMSAPV